MWNILYRMTVVIAIIFSVWLLVGVVIGGLPAWYLALIAVYILVAAEAHNAINREEK